MHTPNPLDVLLARLASSKHLTPDEAQRLADEVGQLRSRIDTLEHVARGNLRHVQLLVPELERAEATLGRVRAARHRIAHAPAYMDAIWCLDQLDAALDTRTETARAPKDLL